MVNVKKTKKILLSIKVTDDEHVHDSKVLPELVNDVIKSNKTVGKLFVDGASYDSNDIFIYLSNNGISPGINVRKNVKVGWKKGNILRNLSSISQKKDVQWWKNNLNCGQR